MRDINVKAIKPKKPVKSKPVKSKATAKPKMTQNLALVVGLQGRFAEAEKIASANLPASEAEANVAYLRQMLARHSSWKKKGKHEVLSAAGS